MRVTQDLIEQGEEPRRVLGEPPADGALVLAFTSRERVVSPDTWRLLSARFPRARLVVTSTAGEICGPHVFDDAVVATALSLEKSTYRVARMRITDAGESAAVGGALARELSGPGLAHVLLLSEGLVVNGSELVRGCTENLPGGVAVTGGLSADGARFERTHVCLDEFNAAPGVVAVGLYGSALRVGFGSLGGWDPFGPERRVTRSAGNVVYELDGQPALDLYEKYLGTDAADLPASGLLFPLTVRDRLDGHGVVRTILAVDHESRSLTFAGDVPVGHYARLMRANFDRLVDGAVGAAQTSNAALGSHAPEFALLVSCVGRKLVLKQRIEEEVEGVERVLGRGVPLTGFYSYGEISPFSPNARCELHNQTMTVTTLSEN